MRLEFAIAVVGRMIGWESEAIEDRKNDTMYKQRRYVTPIPSKRRREKNDLPVSRDSHPSMGVEGTETKHLRKKQSP